MKWTGMKLAGLILMLMTVLSPKVSAGWIVETPDTGEETGRYTSIALDSKGNPHICYDDNATSSVKHAWKDNSGWHTETVESSGSANLCTSLAIDSKDTLHLVYFIFYGSTYGLRFAHREAAGWALELVDPNGWFYASIAVDSNNYPHIGYFDNGNTDAKYAFWNGSGFQLETVASVDDIGREIVLTMDPYDNPVMAFYEDTHQYLFSALRNASGWQVEYVMGGLSSGYGLSTKVDVYGMQMITFFNPIYQYLGLASRYSTGWHFDTIDINHDCGYQSSLALYYTGSPPEAHKCISYRDEATKTLKYFYEDYYGSSISTIDQDGDVGEYSSLAIQNGTQDWEIYPHISYFDRGNGHLKYAYYPSPTPAATATPGGLTCDIYTNQAYFHPHDNFSLILAITNPGPPISQDVYIVLDISGDYWFWPGWKHYPPDTNHQLWIVPTGTTTDNPMQFTWPDITSSGSGIVFHGATLDPGSNNLRSYDSCLFGYGP